MSQRKLLLLHGALGAASQFDKLKERLRNDFDVMAPDFPGHGGRKIPSAQFSFPLFVTDIIGLLNEKEIESIDIFGYSMGGYAALWLAKNYPDRVNSKFTLATKIDWNEDSAKQEARMLNADKVSEKIPAFAKMLEQRHHPENWKIVMRKTGEMIEELGKNHLGEVEFRSILNRTMIGIGDKDNMVSISESENISRALPNGTLQVFTDTPHPIEKVETDLLVHAIKSFFG